MDRRRRGDPPVSDATRSLSYLDAIRCHFRASGATPTQDVVRVSISHQNSVQLWPARTEVVEVALGRTVGPAGPADLAERPPKRRRPATPPAQSSHAAGIAAVVQAASTPSGNLIEMVTALGGTQIEVTAYTELCRLGFNEPVVTRLFSDFAATASDLNHGSCCCFFEHYFRPWLGSVQANPARGVAQMAVAAMSQRREVTVEKVVLSVVTDSSFNAFQRGIISKFLAASFSRDQVPDVVLQVCRGTGGSASGAQRWSDERAAVIHDLVKGGPPLSGSVLDELAQGIATSVEARPTAKHLGKLTLVVLRRAPAEVLPLRGHLRRACDAHATLLKRSLTAALDRLDAT